MMVKKSNNKIDLNKHLKTLVDRYLDMTEDFINSLNRLNKKANYFFENEKEDIAPEDYKEMMRYQDKTKNTINASFTYAFSIFEIYLKEILASEIKHNKIIKERYFGKWDKLINSGEHKKYDISSKILRDENKQFENYDILINHDKTTLIEFMHSLFGIKKPKERTFFSGYIAYYNLSREVRNALTHRGDRFDQKLIDSLESNKSLKDNPLYLQDFYERHLKTKTKRKPTQINTKTLIGSTIRIDYIRTISSLIYLASWFAMSLNKEYDKPGSVLHDKYNDINNFVHKHKCSHLLPMNIRLFKTYKKYLCEDDINKVQDLDKVNFLLSHDLHSKLSIRSLNRFKNNLSKKMPSDKFQEFKASNSKFIKEIKQKNSSIIAEFFTFNTLEKNLQELLKAHLNKDVKSFIKLTEKIKPNKRQLEDWFIFKDYLNNKDFKTLYAKKL